MAQEAQLTPGYIEIKDGSPRSFRPMRLTELKRRADDPDDTQYGIVSVARIALQRRAAGLCEECGVLPVKAGDATCDPCWLYLTGSVKMVGNEPVIVRGVSGGVIVPWSVRVADTIEAAG